MKTAISSALTEVFVSHTLRDTRRSVAALQRKARGATPLLEFFHQVDDPYSHLMLQVLPAVAAQYSVAVRLHLVPAPSDSAAPDRARLQHWSLRDAAMLAATHGLAWPAQTELPTSRHVALAQEAAAQALHSTDTSALTLARLLKISNALWTADDATLAQWTASASAGTTTRNALHKGAQRRDKLGHYLGGTLFFEGEWYWGIDRLIHLETRLRQAGLACVTEPAGAVARQCIIPARDIECVQQPQSGDKPQLHFFCSLRSPYTYLSLPRVRRLAAHYGADLQLRFVMPMVMRGLPVPRNKRLYIVLDTKREADRLGLRFGRIADPVGVPAERGLAVLHHALQAGKGMAFAESFLQGVFADGIDAGSAAGLNKIAARAGLERTQVAAALADNAWRAVADANRQEMLAGGLWGVPSFRVNHNDAIWGQDRLWCVERELQIATHAH